MDIDPKPEPEKLDIDKATVTRENTKESDPNEDERIEASNANSQDQRKKRKRNIMNDVQIKLIERALLDEPEMQRNAAALQAWADTLSNKVIHVFLNVAYYRVLFSFFGRISCISLKNLEITYFPSKIIISHLPF